MSVPQNAEPTSPATERGISPNRVKLAAGAAIVLLVGVCAFADDLLEQRPLRGPDFALAALLALAAALALVAIERAVRARERQARLARRRRDGLQALGEVRDRGGLGEMLARVATCAREVLAGDAAVIAVRAGGEPNQELVVAAAVGEVTAALGTRIPARSGIAGAVARDGATIFTDPDHSLILASDRTMPAAAAVLAAPIARGGEQLGMIAVGLSDLRRRPGSQELDAVGELADLCGLALEQVRLRERAEGRLEAHVEALCLALDVRDHYTASHSDRVVELSCRTGAALGMRHEELEEIELVALMHDIGKLGVPDAILNKQGPLDEAEWRVMREHPAWGADLLRRVPGLGSVADSVLSEHEHWDGSGYPRGLAGEEIPRTARIVLACDAFHAMTSDRPYRGAMERERALAELRDGAGSQFDPEVVAALLAVIAETGEEGSEPEPRPRALGLPRTG